jgi:mRNA-degrading endonuclease toxin of MazEF toxin-antitoxin module
MQATILHPVWPTVIVIPVTSQAQYRHLPTCVDVPRGMGGLTTASVALCRLMMAVDKRRILDYMGALPVENPSICERA